MTTERILPWHRKDWLQILSIPSDRRAHAYLFLGPNGTGCQQFAHEWIAHHVCQETDPCGLACGHCRNCRWLCAHEHPDCLVLEAGDPGGVIKIDSIRHVNRFARQEASLATRRCVLITPAEAMNAASINALLKTLEEPISQLMFVLVASDLDKLPATLVSRVFTYRLSRPSQTEALAWLQQQSTLSETLCQQSLQLTQGAPLLALKLSHEKHFQDAMLCMDQLLAVAEGRQRDVLEISHRFSQLPADRVVHLFYCLAHRLSWKASSEYEQIIKLAKFVDKLHLLQRRRSERDTLNQSIWFDDLCLRWQELFQDPTATATLSHNHT